VKLAVVTDFEDAETLMDIVFDLMETNASDDQPLSGSRDERDDG